MFLLLLLLLLLFEIDDSKPVETADEDVSDQAQQQPEEGELDLTGIDDDEIDSMLLSKDEIKTKAKLWLRANKDWLKEQKAREDQKKKEREESKVVETKQKKPVSSRLTSSSLYPHAVTFHQGVN